MPARTRLLVALVACALPFVAAPASESAAEVACGPRADALRTLDQQPPTDDAMRRNREATMRVVEADVRVLAARNVRLAMLWADRRGVYIVLTYPPCPEGRLPVGYRAYAQSVLDDRYGAGRTVVTPYSIPPAHAD